MRRAGYRLYAATGINDAGQIAVDALRVGDPNQIRAVLLTPNQELVRAVSRKTHGAAGVFDIDLPLTGPPAVECRSGAAGHTLVFTFRNAVTGGSVGVMGCPKHGRQARLHRQHHDRQSGRRTG